MKPRASPPLRLHIERIVLEGPACSPADAERFGRSVARALERELAAASHVPIRGSTVARAAAPAVAASGMAFGHESAARVASSVAGWLASKERSSSS